MGRALDPGTLTDGATVTGDVLVSGRLDAELGGTGAATLSGAEVTGEVRALSGTLSVQTLSPSTLTDGTLASGDWFAAPGATLDLPSITTNDAKLTMEGPGASFGDSLETLMGNGANGSIVLRGGIDHTVSGAFRNEGRVRLSVGSRLHVGARFSQTVTGRLVAELDANGFGRVRAEGRRDLAGDLVIDRDPSFRPPLDSGWTLLASNGRVTPDDRFDDVLSPVFGSRRIWPHYDLNRVRMQVDRVG